MPNPASSGLPHSVSYDTSTPGVAIDSVTGLWWQQPIDGYSGLLADALTYCANLRVGGYCDWRVPTRIELVSIVDYTQFNPAIDATFSGPWAGVAFWTSSPAKGGVPSLAWFVNFYHGDSFYEDGAANSLFVRCVRGG